MSLSQVNKQFKDTFKNIGRAALHSLYPNEFEYYACALELIDSNGSTEEFFVFPVMPDSIDEANMSNTNIKKKAYGVVSLHNTSFIPFPIKISGSFGRKFRIMLGGTEFSNSGFSFEKFKSDPLGEAAAVFNTNVKTGYGAFKVLERIVKSSLMNDKYGLPRKLFFYNLALNSNYLVEFLTLAKSQSIQKNMIWNYNLDMKAIAPAAQVISGLDKSLKNTMKFSVINKTLNGLATTAMSVVTKRKQNRIVNSLTTR